MSTFLLRFETKPVMASDNFGRFAGAYWTAFAVSNDAEGAMRRAVDYAAELGWQFEEGKDIYLVEREHFTGDAELLGLFDVAQRNGIAVVFDTFKKRITESN